MYRIIATCRIITDKIVYYGRFCCCCIATQSNARKLLCAFCFSFVFSFFIFNIISCVCFLYNCVITCRVVVHHEIKTSTDIKMFKWNMLYICYTFRRAHMAM